MTQIPAPLPALPSTAAPASHADAKRAFWRKFLHVPGASLWFWLACFFFTALVWQMLETRVSLREIRQETASRLADNDRTVTHARQAQTQSLAELAALKGKQDLLETQLAELKEENTAIAALYQETTVSRDEALVIEMEQSVQLAHQQLQLAGNVEAAILALQSADTRLQGKDGRFLPLRHALAHDLERLRATPFVDTAGISMQLEAIIAGLDRLPLALDPAPPIEPPAKAMTTDDFSTHWHIVGAEIWREVRSLVHIQRLDGKTPVLMSPDQALALRENLKLRLLNARLALLSRDAWTFKSELTVAKDWLQHYFNTETKATQAAISALDKLARTEIAVTLPTLANSQVAITHLKSSRETR
jgi:uroporphyrin-3 C-methyltransferase